MQPMADGDMNCGQSIQKRFLVVTGCHVVGFCWLPTMRFLMRCCRMPKRGVEIWPFGSYETVAFAASMAVLGSFGFACKSWRNL